MANLAGVDWNLFLVLHTVLEEGSATKAAKRLHVTQSAVSNALARLRVVFGDPLVVRIGNQLVPTAKARELAPRIAAVVAQVGQVLAPREDFDPQTSERQFTLALQGEVPFVADLCVRFGEALPHASLVVLRSPDVGAGLATGELDALVGVVDSVPAGCVAEELFEDELCTLARAPKPNGPRISVHSAGGAGVLVVPSFADAAEVAARSDQVLVCPRRIATVLAARFSLRVAALPRAEPWSVSLVWHARSDADPGAMAFRDLLRTVATV